MNNSTFEIAHKIICDLVDDFDENLNTYMSPGYSEAQVRLDFLDKFFIALGWDVNHEHQKNPYEQEVKVEKGVKDGNTKKRADYAFSIAPNFRDPVFYAEAKKPSVKIQDNPDIYFQVVRYGWNSNTPIGLVTDFEEFHVIDCRHRPDIGNILSRSVQKFRYTQYKDEEEFAKIYWLFSREAVENDSLTKYAETLPKPKGKAIQKSLFKGGYASLDETFLDEIDQIRLALAKAFKKDNDTLTSLELTEATQKIIDRIVFIRFLEDKLIEQEHFISEFGESSSSWDDFLKCSKKMDIKYNGVVFKHHFIDDIKAGDNLEHEFARICNDICHLNSPFDFQNIPIHILGSIYERFLGKQVVVTPKGASIELKPEVRKSGGVYYTPEHIVRYIVQKTIGAEIEGKSPKQISKMKFADIACGSGSFLIGVLDYLFSYHNNYYQNNPNHALQDGCINENGQWVMPLRLRQKILINNVYGVDIDSQAAEVTQVSLFLKLLEDETTASAHQMTMGFNEALLPSLSNNILCGNSLIGTDILFENILEDHEVERTNPFDFNHSFAEVMDNGGFDCIVGNPPYDVLEKERNMDFLPHAILTEYIKNNDRYDAAKGGKLNLFRFFVVRCIELTKEKGRYGFIIPMSILGDKSCAKARSYLLDWSQELQADCFPQKDNAQRRVFLDAKLSTAVISGIKHEQKKSGNKKILVRTYPWNSLKDNFKEAELKLEEMRLLDPKTLPIPLIDSVDWEIVQAIYKSENIKRIGDLKDINVRRGEINQTTYKKFIVDDSTKSKMIKGAEVGKYTLNDKMSQGKYEWFDSESFLESNSPREVVSLKRIATQRITGVDEKDRIVAAVVDKDIYFADSTNSINLTTGSKYHLNYLLGLLNSRVYQWRFKLTSTNNNVGTNEIESMPFPVINFKNENEKKTHARIVDLVSKIISLKNELLTTAVESKINFNERMIHNFQGQIDSEFCALLGVENTDHKLRVTKI